MTSHGLVHFPDTDCERTEHEFVFLGPDGMLGISEVSCDGAFLDWSHGPDPKKFNKI